MRELVVMAEDGTELGRTDIAEMVFQERARGRFVNARTLTVPIHTRGIAMGARLAGDLTGSAKIRASRYRLAPGDSLRFAAGDLCIEMED